MAQVGQLRWRREDLARERTGRAIGQDNGGEGAQVDPEHGRVHRAPQPVRSAQRNSLRLLAAAAPKYGECFRIIANITSPHATSTCGSEDTEL